MSQIEATIHGTVETTKGTAHLAVIENGGIAVGDVVGVYVPRALIPAFDAKVREIRRPSQGSVERVSNEGRRVDDLLCALYFEETAQPVFAGAWLAANTTHVVARYGVTVEDLLV